MAVDGDVGEVVTAWSKPDADDVSCGGFDASDVVVVHLVGDDAEVVALVVECVMILMVDLQLIAFV